MKYTIAQAAAKMNLTAYTLRYYEKEGMLPEVDRAASGIRMYSEKDLELISIICCLKNSGMPLKQIKIFVKWCMEGDITLEKRRQLFIEHKKSVLSQMESLKKHLDKINCKIDYYNRACAAGTESVCKNKCE